MNRTDRLMQLVQIMRDGRLHRAQDMADRLGVTVRTIYRDMDTLMSSGLPIEGARGLGYMITAEVTLPPLNLTMTELEALHFGLAVVGEGADAELQGAARSLSAKIDAVLPEDRRAPPKGFGFAIYPFADAAQGFQHMPAIRGAIRSRQKLSLTYRALSGEIATRTVRPLELEYWGRVWTATCWCELRQDFEVFRVDRIETLKVLPALFVDEEGKTLADYDAQHR